MKAIYHHRRLFAFGIFSSTLILALFLKKKKLQKIHHVIQGCVKIPINEELFKSKISLYRYRGFIFPGDIVMSGVLQQLPLFQFHENDIIVASFPKSGTTWIQEIVYMLTHNFEPSSSTTEVLETRFPYLEYPYPGLKAVSEMKGQRYIKTHLPSTLLPPNFVSSGAKLIYIIRNPRDTAVSYWHFMQLLSVVNFVGSFHQFAHLFLADKVPYGPYFEHIKSYTTIADNTCVLLIYYEDLKQNPIEVIKDIAKFLQIPATDEDAIKVAASTSFGSMVRNKSVNYEHWKDLGFANKNGRFLRKGEVGDWKNYFSPDLLQSFEAWESLGSKEAFTFKFEILP